MSDILILFVQVSLILSFFSSNLVLQNKYRQNKIELNPDIIINLAAEVNFGTVSKIQKKKMIKICFLKLKIKRK